MRDMAALKPPVLPQLALSRVALPDEDGWSFEPKWDGFRAIAFVDGKESFLQSRNGKPLGRYFPELKFPPGEYVLDGELVIMGADGKQEFDVLQQRIHPAESRVRKLAEETPVRFVAFDLLAADGKVAARRALRAPPRAARAGRAQADRPHALDAGASRGRALAARTPRA